ncbi:MAG TPA: glycosyltransferase family 4 protein [candidate division Zixibacteria bacterium]|nr:glycosyltransferase family 4 protein [candidate division Zixibacteria bacterium]MDD4917779.1 glycosyltransferase family 4 protein [candidate division Zixibacteria bacterium]MDM7971890.1 glycosyltransferase family 4 protein [candidate division Zixibacteria bacterium]HOD66963.1 glycosyltransferase family 4 protein [candidate division Zixibacteria bacterium]HOZ07837.1 glycosyltransferase family 4 protein [candidate division Zixibacteria bacterium]
MKVLIVTQHYPPERGAVRRLAEFARQFVKAGMDVSVLTAVPNYPDGIVPEKYRGKFFYRETVDGVKVYRSYVMPASNRFPGRRMVGFVIFLITALINSFRIKGNFDLILASTPPVTTPVIGWVLSRVRRAKLIIEIRDLQPESSEEFGNLRPSLFTRMLKKFMHMLYRRADHVVTATDGIANYLTGLGFAKERVTTIKSGVGREFLSSDSNGIRRKFGWDEKFLVLYAGTLGWAHSLETVIEAARHLVDQPDIHFVFAGEGQKRQALEGMVRDYGLKNVTFIGLQSLETIPYFLRASDVLVESLKEVPITKGTFPCKLFEYMASGRPIIFGSSGGEAVSELEKAGGALWFSTDRPERLSELILQIKGGEIDGGRLGAAYQAHVDRYHRREVWADRYLEVIRSLS